ncbi:lipopolysaccharide biosynthesis protein [uncultured Shimia sp.]|uniref:GumC family protein n=1 Tax=uncultured Shimia sp. TaxID=573152 RepID=UPI0026090175|nr:lipopolysaccharide biosynthesis protein [uncultured Shimia sp.]
MSNVSYYFSIFRRRLPYFLLIATAISAISITVAYTLPPAYESRMILLVESPQIPTELAPTTVKTPAFEQLQVVQHRLLTRANMLEIARKHDVFPDLNKMGPDEIVNAMRARTSISTSNQRRKDAPVMTITFEAPQARTAARVLNEYLTLIQKQDTELRKGRAGETLAFFSQEVERLSNELDLQSVRILEFKQANTGALPDSLQHRLSQQANFQDRLIQTDRDIADLRNQRIRLLQLFELTGNINTPQDRPLSPNERQLASLNQQLEEALSVYSTENPRVKMLEARIEQLENKIAAASPATQAPQTPEGEKELPPMLVLQLGEIDSRVQTLQAQKIGIQAEIDKLKQSMSKTPAVSIKLEEMNRKYETLQNQYEMAEQRLSVAQTGDRIETRSRGQRIAVIEQPAIPSSPTKPNRTLIAGGGSAFAIIAGLVFIFILELLNTTARRPEDIINKLGVTPLTTIPYIQSRSQQFRRRGMKLLVILVILIGIPAVVFAIHTYYLPLDLLAERAMNKFGIRW